MAQHDHLWYAQKMIEVMIGLSVMSTATTLGIHAARTNQLPSVFLAAILAWSGYLFTHYIVSGQFIHQRSEDGALSTGPGTIHGALIGVFFIVTGAGIGFFALGTHDHLTTTLAFITAIIGYMITHYELTGTLL